MPTMGKYCKAYPLHRLRKFSGWSEKLRLDSGGTSNSLGDDDYLFVQHNLVVTDGIFLDQNIVFDRVTTAWQEFCKAELRFEVPSYIAAVQ
jgi:hypothetical protein